VEDASLKGRVRTTLRPLLRRVPVVGAVQVTLPGGSPPAGMFLPYSAQCAQDAQ
jgi:hypothetical protein